MEPQPQQTPQTPRQPIRHQVPQVPVRSAARELDWDDEMDIDGDQSNQRPVKRRLKFSPSG